MEWGGMKQGWNGTRASKRCLLAEERKTANIDKQINTFFNNLEVVRGWMDTC